MDIRIGRLYVNSRGEIITIEKIDFSKEKIYYYYLDDPKTIMWFNERDFFMLFRECEYGNCW